MAAVAALLCLAQEAPREDVGWTTGLRTRAELSYNSNLWYLGEYLEDRLEQDAAVDEATGRFADMETVDDFIFTPAVRFLARGPGLSDERLSLWLDLQYSAHFQNPRRDFFDLDAKASQRLGDADTLALSLSWLPHVFNRNYLADAVDLFGFNSRDERRYAHGDYAEIELQLEYHHNFLEGTAEAPLGIQGAVVLGYRHRDYEAPFESRSERAPSVELTLRFKHEVPARWGLRYRYSPVRSPQETDIFILDEPDYGLILNGDGEAADFNARAVVEVDRSHHEHLIGGSLEFDLDRGLDLRFTYAVTLRDYVSEESLDFSNRGRFDTRHEIGIDLGYRVSKAWDAALGYEYRKHETDRPNVPDAADDTFDYERHIVSLSVTFKL